MPGPSLCNAIQMHSVRQFFPRAKPVDIESTIATQLQPLQERLTQKCSVAVGVGSRGIANYDRIVKAVIDQLTAFGTKPFLVPAMGSHGGATSAGQTQVLADYGITEQTMGVPIRATMEASVIGKSPSGYDLWSSVLAQEADHVFVINRVKPHTDFHGTLGSGCLKMLTIGFGKREGAANYHQNAIRAGYETVLRELGAELLQHLPVLGGIGIVEDHLHQTAALELIQPDNWIPSEEALVARARELMPRLPVEDIDLLIVDRIGKNLSGTGMDTNIIGRDVHGYSTLVDRKETQSPYIKRIYVRGLTPETHGNAIGIGMADFTRQSLVDQIDREAMYVNSLTSLALHAGKIPITCSNDEQAVDQALISSGVINPSEGRVLRITDTLNLETFHASEALLADLRKSPGIEISPEGSDLLACFNEPISI